MADRSKNKNKGIGERIKLLRVDWGLTQKELAVLVNKGESTVRMWELGKSEPDIETIKLLAEVFNVTVDQIIIQDQELINALKSRQLILSKGEENLISLLRSLPEDSRSLGHQLIESSLQALLQSSKKG
jgi:transcriptional regulator with XRE-family HTH domain